MLEHQNEHFVRDLLKCHTLQRQNQRFPTGFLMDLPREASVDFHHLSQMPPLPRNLQLVTTSPSADNAIRKKHATRHV